MSLAACQAIHRVAYPLLRVPRQPSANSGGLAVELGLGRRGEAKGGGTKSLAVKALGSIQISHHIAIVRYMINLKKAFVFALLRAVLITGCFGSLQETALVNNNQVWIMDVNESGSKGPTLGIDNSLKQALKADRVGLETLVVAEQTEIEFSRQAGRFKSERYFGPVTTTFWL